LDAKNQTSPFVLIGAIACSDIKKKRGDGVKESPDNLGGMPNKGNCERRVCRLASTRRRRGLKATLGQDEGGRTSVSWAFHPEPLLRKKRSPSVIKGLRRGYFGGRAAVGTWETKKGGWAVADRPGGGRAAFVLDDKKKV